MKITSRSMLACLLCLGLLPVAWGQAAPGVKVEMGEAGLKSLAYNGTELLWGNPSDNSGAFDGRVFYVQRVVLQKAGVADTPLADGGPSQVSVDAARQAVTRTFAWGTASCAYISQGSRLNLVVTVTNKTKDETIKTFYFQPLWLHFPQTPQGYDGNPRLANNQGNPSVVEANYGTGTLALCNDDVIRPLVVGFPFSLDRPGNTVYPIRAGFGEADWLNFRLTPFNVRPIAPGKSDTYHLSLRFGPAGTSAASLAADLDRKFAQAFPFQLHWADRRPMGYLMLSSTVPHPPGGKNQRGWFGNDAGVDVTTETGLADFKKRLMDYADSSIKVLKAMNAQGAITWDIQGQEFPHATSYIGDPRILSDLAPETEPLADEYFKKFRAAGLSVGVCIRPQQFSRAKGQQELTDPAQIVRLLVDKAAYANKRWGCTLFYIDSNGDPNFPYDAAIFQKVAQALAQRKIKALLMPEQQNARYYAYTAPYDELRGGVVSTPEYVRRIYPAAFEVINTSDGPLDARHDELVAAVRRGDILLFRAWFDDPGNAKVKAIYAEAGKK